MSQSSSSVPSLNATTADLPRRYHTAVSLSSGGTAEIFKAWDEVLRADVALKFLRRDDPTLVERMLREARAQARLDHPGICKVYEVGELDGRPFIAMQYIDGVELGQAAVEMTTEDKVQVMLQVAQAIHHAHQQGLVHRDLKPSNIMVETTADGRQKPVVVDFGLVYETVDDQTSVTHAGQVLGTPPYLAPEQVEGRRDRLDRRTDVYGLGATLYELLTGRPPFIGERTVDLLIQTLHDEPAPPGRLVPSLPVELETITLRCLEKEPARRYPSARALAEDLARFRDGEPILARPPSLGHRLVKSMRRHRLAVTVGVVLGIGALCALAMLRFQAEQRLHYEQRFAQIGRDLDWSLRATHMSARHDISDALTEVRDRLRTIEDELPQLGRLGQPPAHLAMGRIYAALGDDDAARHHLETAWQAGYETPEVGYALGLVLGRQYEHELERVRHLKDPELRQRLTDALHRDLRDPARRYLEVGRDADTGSPEYLEALLAFYDQRYEDALVDLAKARQQLPWLFEAQIAEGRILTQMGDAASLEDGDSAAAAALLTRALEAFAEAAESAPSSPGALIGACHAGARRLRLEMQVPDASLDGQRDAVFDACQSALDVQPDNTSALIRHSEAHRLWARHVAWGVGDPAPHLETSLASARRAVELSPDRAGAHTTLGAILVLRGEVQTATRSGDPRPDLEASAAAFERSLELTPDNPSILNLLGGVWRIRATWEARNGYDAVDSANRALASLDAAIEVSPNLFDRHHNRGNALGLRCYLLYRKGETFHECLEEMEASYRRAVELNPDMAWAYTGLGTSLSMQADWARRIGEDPDLVLDEAFGYLDQAIALTPEVAEFHFWRSRFHLTRGLYALQRGEDPSRALEEARRDLSQAAGLRAGRPDEPMRALEIETLALRWAMQSGQSLTPSLRAGDRLLESIEGNADRGLFYISTVAEYHLRAVAALNDRGQAAPDRLQRGLQVVEQGIEGRLEIDEQLGRRGALRWLASRSETSPETRRQLMLQAEQDLTEALQTNRWLDIDLDPWLREVRQGLERGPRLETPRG